MTIQLLEKQIDKQKIFKTDSTEPVFLKGDAFELLKLMPNNSIDFAMTSPPYWAKREYSNGGIGIENDYNDFIENLLTIFHELQRVLKKTGSFWLNIGDSYLNKQLLGIPWRLAIRMIDEQGWFLRNEVIWNKVKGGPDQAKDKLGNVHEQVFHFVKDVNNYYYDVDAIRTPPKKSKIVNGAIVTATGVSGIRYKRQIELSSILTLKEKKAALNALNEILSEVYTTLNPFLFHLPCVYKPPDPSRFARSLLSIL